MPKVTFLPAGVTVEGAPGETILEVALNHDIDMQHACGGFCACTTCHVHVESGLEGLSSIEDDEQERLEMAASDVTLRSRLGCQAKLGKGDVTVKLVN